MKFNEFDFDQQLMDSLEAMRFEEATPIQTQAIPIINEGKDLIACAQTGTGKTAAYLLPVINRLVSTEHSGINTVVLVPTRELAIQIDQQMEGFGYFVPVCSTAVYGGNDSAEWNRQRTSLTRGADIVITTPGRMLQHMTMGYVDFSNVRHLILDEADRMLDMGFFDDIMQVVKTMPVEGRQTLMFSATMPPKIRDLAKKILRDPAEISIAISKPAEGIRQGAYLVYDTQKPALIKHILKEKNLPSVIIFSSRKQSVKQLAHALKRSGFNAGVIHSDLEQKEREEVLREFKNRNIQILVATDIIARGIDIEKIDLVINYDVPRDAEDYVHRIGRTARAQTQGEAITFINEKEMVDFYRIEQLIETTVEKLPLMPDLGEGPEYNPTKRRKGGNSRRGGAKAEARPEGNGGNGNKRRRNNGRKPRPEGQPAVAAEQSQPAQQPQDGQPAPQQEAQAGDGQQQKRRGNRRRNRHGRRPKPEGEQAQAPQQGESAE